jgi:squalene-associated FAD-dependent desaturase
MAQADNRADVVVVGGGLAGISAAIELAEAGLRVTLLEARPWLGGATCSFARRGLTIDNGQHAFIGGCEAYRDLLAKLGVLSSVAIQDRLHLAVLGAASQQAPPSPLALRRSGLPAPLHLASALAGYRQLTVAERVKAAAAALALPLTAPRARAGRESFGDWLAEHGQDENARRTFWDVLSVAALGLPSADADLGLAGVAVRTVLGGRENADIGIPLVPLSRLHASPAVALLANLGCRILLGVQAAGCQLSHCGGYEIAVAPAPPGGGTAPVSVAARPRLIHAAALVLAVPAWEAAALAPAELAADAAAWARLEPSPVVSLHVLYASKVTSLPFAAVVNSPVRWVIDKTGPAGLHTGQYLAVSVPAADKFVDLPSSRLRADLLPELERLLPAATDAEVDDLFTTRERRAFIRQVPGSQRLRASQPGIRGLALAGAWTDTGWPDSMEGAVRSGLGAAWKVLRDVAGSGADAAAAAYETAEPAIATSGVANSGVANSGVANSGAEAGGPVTSLAPAR